jgi:uncharacterized paraquat-inducible protein A
VGAPEGASARRGNRLEIGAFAQGQALLADITTCTHCGATLEPSCARFSWHSHCGRCRHRLRVGTADPGRRPTARRCSSSPDGGTATASE